MECVCCTIKQWSIKQRGKPKEIMVFVFSFRMHVLVIIFIFLPFLFFRVSFGNCDIFCGQPVALVLWIAVEVKSSVASRWWARTYGICSIRASSEHHRGVELQWNMLLFFFCNLNIAEMNKEHVSFVDSFVCSWIYFSVCIYIHIYLCNYINWTVCCVMKGSSEWSQLWEFVPGWLCIK